MDKSIPQQQFGFGGSFRTANLRCAIAIKMWFCYAVGANTSWKTRWVQPADPQPAGCARLNDRLISAKCTILLAFREGICYSIHVTANRKCLLPVAQCCQHWAFFCLATGGR
jgi:hypothetical protein